MITGTVGLRQELEARLAKRGWRFRESGDQVVGRVGEWPHQLQLIVDAGGPERPSALGLAVNFDAMPLGGERFRDILNADREETFLTYGTFKVRQQLKDGSWSPEVGHRGFLHGYGSGSGISRRTALAFFDRCPEERGVALVDRVMADLGRIAETGQAFTATLQRIYQRTVLSGDDLAPRLPDVVGTVPRPSLDVLLPAAAAAPAQAPAYPWRR